MTLMIGIVTTLFTAVFVCKVIFDAYLAAHWKKAERQNGEHLKEGMKKCVHLIRPGTTIDFVGKRNLWMGISVFCIAADGLPVFHQRPELRHRLHGRRRSADQGPDDLGYRQSSWRNGVGRLKDVKVQQIGAAAGQLISDQGSRRREIAQCCFDSSAGDPQERI